MSSDMSISQRVVRAKTKKLLRRIVDKPFSPGLVRGFQTWYSGFDNSMERNVIYQHSMGMMMDAERRLKLLKESLQKDIFKRGGNGNG